MNESYRHYSGERSQTQNKKWFHIIEILEQMQLIYIDSNRISRCPDWEMWMKPDCKKDWGNFRREIEVVITCCIQLSKRTNYRLKLWILKYINYTSEGWLGKKPSNFVLSKRCRRLLLPPWRIDFYGSCPPASKN